MALIAALKELRGRMVSGDEGRIAGLFNFPLPDSVFNLYVDDSLFQQEYTKHGNALTAPMFKTYFKKIGAGLDSFEPLFVFLNPDSLLRKDTIQHDDIIDTLPYYTNYSIMIDGDSLVSIRFMTGPNGSYTRPGGKVDTAKVSEEEEEDPSAYEHATGWEFAFDGKKLQFLREYQAD